MEARLYTPDPGNGPRHVLFMKGPGMVSWQGRDYTPAELEAAYPGYVLEITRGYPQAGVGAGFRGAILFDEDAWHPTKTPTERVLSSYWAAWWISLFVAYWLEGRGIVPWDWILPDGSGFVVRWALAIALVSLAAVPLHRWIAGIVDTWVVQRIQHYTTRRAVKLPNRRAEVRS